ncbi:MAG TPA: hypothetical protein VNT26_04345, partial [Candidatus Sulfotelmatobacter sp.]|nr:hypothetical protein [Candidatus Sulfotelmatobacter sp.]
MLKVHVCALALVGVCWLARPLAVQGADILISEDFASSPALHGWQTYGETNLFSWNAANQNLEVTWDSSKENSYFLHPLGATLNRSNDFILRFDLRLADIAIGTQPDKPYTFQIAVGLLNLTNATNANFLRGTGFTSPNLVEFDYFPDSGFGATVSPALISSNNEYNDGGFTFPLELTAGDLYHVEMRFIAAQQTLTTRMTRNGQPFGPVNN